MCVAFPGKIVKLEDDNFAIVEIFGVKKRISLDILPEEVNIGDYVISHAGFAIHKVDSKEAEETIKLIKDYIESENE